MQSVCLPPKFCIILWYCFLKIQSSQENLETTVNVNLWGGGGGGGGGGGKEGGGQSVLWGIVNVQHQRAL